MIDKMNVGANPGVNVYRAAGDDGGLSVLLGEPGEWVDDITQSAVDAAGTPKCLIESKPEDKLDCLS